MVCRKYSIFFFFFFSPPNFSLWHKEAQSSGRRKIYTMTGDGGEDVTQLDKMGSGSLMIPDTDRLEERKKESDLDSRWVVGRFDIAWPEWTTRTRRWSLGGGSGRVRPYRVSRRRALVDSPLQPAGLPSPTWGAQSERMLREKDG